VAEKPADEAEDLQKAEELHENGQAPQ